MGFIVFECGKNRIVFVWLIFVSRTKIEFPQGFVSVGERAMMQSSWNFEPERLLPFLFHMIEAC